MRNEHIWQLSIALVVVAMVLVVTLVVGALSSDLDGMNKYHPAHNTQIEGYNAPRQ